MDVDARSTEGSCVTIFGAIVMPKTAYAALELLYDLGWIDYHQRDPDEITIILQAHDCSHRCRLVHRRPTSGQPKIKFDAVEQAAMARDRGACRYCGSTDNITTDHVVPKSKGGAHDLDNVVICCKWCNVSKGNRTPDDARMALLPAPEEA